MVQHDETLVPVETSQDTLDIKGAATENEVEHSLTLRQLWKESPAVIGWSFYWSMCAIGWYVQDLDVSYVTLN